MKLTDIMQNMITPHSAPRLSDLLQNFANHPDAALLHRACELSPFCKCLLEADESLLVRLLDDLHRPFAQVAMRDFLADRQITGEAELKQALRLLRKRVVLCLLVRDLNGLANLAEVMQTMTELAEVVVTIALDHLERWQRVLYGDPVGESGAPQQLMVVGMGKLGGSELNVSSDIDLIFAYAEDGETRGGNGGGAQPISNHEYFVRLGKKLIGTLHDLTPDGFVFRVDMRLRPYGDSGPLVGSLAMLEDYYQTQGREWERYAWIKGRVICPVAAKGGAPQELEILLAPFVYRKYLDYGAFASMRKLKVQIANEVSRREMYDNIKLGTGGIRSIEFIAQVFQLIRGGRDAVLQSRATLSVLELLGNKGLLSREAIVRLSDAYVFLRNLEHRLQYLQDAQTQTLPTDDENRSRIAQGMNFADWNAFVLILARHRAYVQELFDEVFSSPEAPSNAEHTLAPLWQGLLADGEAEARLGELGYHDPAAVWGRIRRFRESAKYCQLPIVSRERFDALAPLTLEIAAGFANPNETLLRILDLLENICRRASYLALLVEYPQALSQVARLVSASPWLASYLTQHPVLLDELLDTHSLYAAPDFAALHGELETRLQEVGDDVENKMNILRDFKHAQTFRFAAQDIAGQLALETLSDYLSALADLVLDAVLRHAWPGLRGRHCEQPRFAVIGYGKLGGKELGYASDLDLVFLYDDDALVASEVYARFCQRINAWLGSLTSSGLLYETDLRLRPDGASGLQVSSVEAFAQYQQHKAWTWEHQALTRARFCAGDDAIGAAFERIRLDITRQQRDTEKLCEEVIIMRKKMYDGHPVPAGWFDLKHSPGGIVDVEFAVQYLVLAHTAQQPQLAGNIGNIALLKLAAELELVPADLALQTVNAYRAYRREQHALRLQGAETARVADDLYQDQRMAVHRLWQHTFGGNA